MKEYSIQRVGEQPDWSNLPVLKMEQSYLDSPEDIQAYAQIGYHETALMVHLWAQEQRIRAVEKDVLGMPCEDSCLEFFLRPVAEDLRYFNFEFNPNLCMYLGFGKGIHDLIRLAPENARELFQPAVRRFDGGWELFFRIPYDFIRRFFPGFTAKAGTVVRANCYKCGDLTEPPHYYSWSPVDLEEFTFHRSECFGTMTLK